MEIPFVHDIQERREFTGSLAVTVHPGEYGNEADPEIGEDSFRIEANFQIVAAYTAHVLCQHTANQAVFSIFHERR